MTEQRPSPRGDVDTDDVTLRLLWPQWQGAGTSSVQALAPEFPFAVARRGYAVGSAVLAAVLPANQGPTAAAPVAMDDTGLELVDGIEAKQVILRPGRVGRAARLGQRRHRQCGPVGHPLLQPGRPAGGDPALED